jgi:hypothetical protein
MKKSINAALALMISISINSVYARAVDHDPEQEQDYGPGFFSGDVDTTQDDFEGGEINTDLPDQDELTEILKRENPIELLLSFPQKTWMECTDHVTGNYTDYACVAKGRPISVILDAYLQRRLLDCVDAGLAAQGGGTAQALHITHAGITADARHSPHSLHSVNRAIDVKVIQVLLSDRTRKQFTYSKVGNRPFYTALRTCWGRTVNLYNACPLYDADPALTGSIGWENARHGRHMHLSVPYCLGGRYGSGLWRR